MSQYKLTEEETFYLELLKMASKINSGYGVTPVINKEKEYFKFRFFNLPDAEKFLLSVAERFNSRGIWTHWGVSGNYEVMIRFYEQEVS